MKSTVVMYFVHTQDERGGGGVLLTLPGAFSIIHNSIPINSVTSSYSGLLTSSSPTMRAHVFLHSVHFLSANEDVNICLHRTI